MNERGLAGVWKIVILVVIGLVLLVLISMLMDESREPPELSANPECPHYDGTRLALPAEITGIPEYHDCQKLIEMDDESYGPLAGVFVRKNADSVVIPEVTIPLTVGVSGGVLDPAGNQVAAIIPTPQQEQQFRANAIAIAEIKSWDSAYPPLGIDAGLNCLFVVRVRFGAGNQYGYAALMWPLAGGTDDSICLPQGAPAQGGKWLKVRHTKLADGAPAYPAVARWDRDGNSKKHYVSMICASDWCEVGDTDFQPVPTRDVTSGTVLEQIRWEQKGRYDEQRLAVMVGGVLRPSSVLATASPHPDLATYDVASFEAWRPVARTVLPTDLLVYNQKFNFGPGSIPGIVNDVSLCYGRRFFGGCLPFLAALRTMFTIPCWKSQDGEFWWARIVSSNGPTRYRCTNRITHDMQNVPDAVRWRWKHNDEGLWTRCAAGCCEVYGDE